MLSHAKSPAQVSWPVAKPALVCMLCSRQVGEVIQGRAVHHQGCLGKLTRMGGVVRCCTCSGAVTIEEGLS